ncbi:hypothetical protein YPPY66_3762 [Yersinia pestis PY-66]|uniref:Uncharacterized protein n=2 Tax=Yersinia pseudotuberculosis complex TaxID=1649845 RepID=A0A0U1R0M4_YERP3|nr:hypothetical protein YpsIP31758_1291 [Yersinia pseudotuberculosis IP 31758]ABX85371.1 hypothetical protein YpAngola_A2778 [Yersinia pestis Angola]EDR34679.1 hypothetical protein YPIP275_3480 [Yersinia pestis biovar Orientalis str. IP275]EDR38427.1 hypothetical protein YpF1991016_2029 [Yersinia pestis biovar Orientalis str. F1991016]EDR51030.1 hypothetical protein YpB42003004_0691 [Yersinia pestis biovar Antiqua str. B42003004]EDR55443.1 hypothetical protein YpMG051020_4766 [Yersinia pestis 
MLLSLGRYLSALILFLSLHYSLFPLYFALSQGNFNRFSYDIQRNQY